MGSYFPKYCYTVLGSDMKDAWYDYSDIIWAGFCCHFIFATSVKLSIYCSCKEEPPDLGGFPANGFFGFFCSSNTHEIQCSQ